MLSHQKEARQADPYYRTISDKMDIALRLRRPTYLAETVEIYLWLTLSQLLAGTPSSSGGNLLPQWPVC